MTQTNFFTSPLDPDTARRVALANVYRLLIQLAEEAEKENAELETIEANEEKKDDSK